MVALPVVPRWAKERVAKTLAPSTLTQARDSRYAISNFGEWRDSRRSIRRRMVRRHERQEARQASLAECGRQRWSNRSCDHAPAEADTRQSTQDRAPSRLRQSRLERETYAGWLESWDRLGYLRRGARCAVHLAVGDWVARARHGDDDGVIEPSHAHPSRDVSVARLLPHSAMMATSER